MLITICVLQLIEMICGLLSHTYMYMRLKKCAKLLLFLHVHNTRNAHI